MINYLKKKYNHFISKKLSKKLTFINNLIYKKEYEKAQNLYSELEKYISRKYLGKKHLLCFLTGIHLSFIQQKYQNVLFMTEQSLVLINETQIGEDKLMEYFKGFVYNLKFLSALFLDDKETANKAKNEFNKLEIKLEEGYFLSLETKYPIYDEDDLQKLFTENEYFKSYTKEKLDYIIECEKNIFDLDKDIS